MADIPYYAPVAPVTPVADNTSAQLVAQIGNAGLAAFVNMSNQRRQAQMQEKALQMKAIDDAQQFQLQREQMANTFKMHEQTLLNERQMVGLRSSIVQKDQQEQNQQTAQYLIAKNAIEFPIGSPERASAEAKLFELYPRAMENKWVQDRFAMDAQAHDQAEALKKLGEVMPKNPNVQVEYDSKGGWKVVEKPPGIENSGVATERMKALNKETGQYRNEADAERKTNMGTPNVLYSRSKEWAGAEAEKAFVEAGGKGTFDRGPAEAAWSAAHSQPTTATPSAVPAPTDKFIVGKVYTDAAGNKATYLGNGQWQ